MSLISFEKRRPTDCPVFSVNFACLSQPAICLRLSNPGSLVETAPSSIWPNRITAVIFLSAVSLSNSGYTELRDFGSILEMVTLRFCSDARQPAWSGFHWYQYTD